MAGIRDIKRAARRVLHKHLEVEALYLVPAAGVPGYETPIPITVRLQLRFTELGDLKGTSFHFAERKEQSPQIIFLREQIATPARNAVVSIEQGEAYRIDNVKPPDDITIAADAIRMKASETVDLPVPDPSNHTPASPWDDGYFVDDGQEEPYDPDDDA